MAQANVNNAIVHSWAFSLQFKNQWLQRLVHGAKIVRLLGLAVEKTVDSECAATPGSMRKRIDLIPNDEEPWAF